MKPEIFEELYLGEWKQDEEYKMYYDLWMEYRKRTNHLERNESKYCRKVHKELFEHVPKNKKYQEAKIETARIFENARSVIPIAYL